MSKTIRIFSISILVLLMSSQICSSVEFPSISLKSMAVSYGQSTIKGIGKVVGAQVRAGAVGYFYTVEPASDSRTLRAGIKFCSHESLAMNSFIMVLASDESLIKSCNPKNRMEPTRANQLLVLPGIVAYKGGEPKLYFKLPNNMNHSQSCGTEDILLLTTNLSEIGSKSDFEVTTVRDGLYISRESFFSCVDEVNSRGRR